MRKLKTTGILTLAVGFIAVMGSAALAATWDANPGASYDESTETLTLDSADGPTSYETTDLGVAIESGDKVTFDFDGPCTAGAPRVFLEVDGTYYNTWDGNAEGDCGQGVQGADAGTAVYTYPGPDGDIGHFGLVNDTGSPSVIEIRDVTIGDDAVELAEIVEDDSPQSKDECKNGGWEAGEWRNQGQCVSHFARNR